MFVYSLANLQELHLQNNCIMGKSAPANFISLLVFIFLKNIYGQGKMSHVKVVIVGQRSDLLRTV